MNNLDKFRYSYDDPSQLNISLKKDPYEKATNQKSDNINQLLSTSVRVTKEIFPNINSAIDNVFKRLKIENNLNFFVTANHFQTQATCSAMPLGDSAEIILTSKLIELLNGEELESVIAHEVAHFYYQHALYPQPNSSMNRVETLNLLNFSRAAEISADRIGFIGCGSLESSLRAMLKITSGLSDKHLKFNLSNYLDQLRDLKEIKGDKNLIYSTHTNFLNRMQALIWFSMSNEYNKDFNINKFYDVIYFDAFAPNKQPELWKVDVFSKLFNLTSNNGVLVTYCAKGQVRRDLEKVGYFVERLEGPPGKREMLRATKV